MSNWNLRLIGYNDDLSIGLQLNFDGRNEVSLSRIQLLAFALFPTVVAVVAFDEPTEQVRPVRPVHADRQRGRPARRRRPHHLSPARIAPQIAPIMISGS